MHHTLHGWDIFRTPNNQPQIPKIPKRVLWLKLVPKTAVNLATPAGARLIGYYFDSNSRNSAFSNKDPALHEDFRNTVREVFGNLSISETIMERGGFGKGHYIRTNVGYTVRTAMSIAGFDCTRD